MDAAEAELSGIKTERDNFSTSINTLEQRLSQTTQDAQKAHELSRDVRELQQRLKGVEGERDSLTGTQKVAAERIALCEARIQAKDNELRISQLQLDEQRKQNMQTLQLEVRLSLLLLELNTLMHILSIIF